MPGPSLRPLGLVALMAAASLPVATALDPTYCGSANIADMSAYYDDLQTNGLCHDHCFDEYAFAITQGNNCWCTNYGPADSIQINMSKCNQPCPAYPPESCGGKGAYSYLKLNNNIKASGTKGSSSDDEPTSTSESEDSTTSEPAPETTSSSTTLSSTESSTSTSSSETEEDETSSTSEKPTTSRIQTVTKDGIVTTVFLAPTNAATDADGASGNNSSKDTGGGDDGISKGALAGIIVGVIAGVAVIAGIIVWFFLRRRKTQQEQDGYQEDPSIRGSSSGMMGAGGTRTEMSQSGGSPGSPNTNSNRNSALLIDPRMDPFKQGLYMRSNSHESINTLRDDHDYSRRIQQPRTLRATNPDPETQD